MPETVARLVDQVTRTDRDMQISRWHEPICLRMVGVDAVQAAFIASRVDDLARGLGIPMEGGDYDSHLVVFAMDDADGFTRGLIAR